MNREIEEKCKELNSKGYLISEISKELNISKSDVYNCLCNGNKIINRTEKEIISNLIKQKYSLKEIAKISGRSLSSIYRVSKDPSIVYDTYQNSKNELDPDTLLRIKYLYELNYSIADIADISKISRDTIKYRLVKMGIYKNKYTKVSKSEIQRINKLYKLGYSISKISKETNRSYKTVQRYIKDNEK